MITYIITNEQTGHNWEKNLASDIPPWRYVLDNLDTSYTYWIKRK